MAETVPKLLGKSFKCHISDGRLVTGRLRCTDADCNFVLADANEYGQDPTSASTDNYVLRRRLGLCLVPGKHIVSISLLQDDIINIDAVNTVDFSDEHASSKPQNGGAILMEQDQEPHEEPRNEEPTSTTTAANSEDT